ncbi:hypothetical protein JCM10207_001535 [Rhodosporidiobolus poonsookiae]
MSGPSALKRKAAQAPKYTFDAGSDEEQEQDEAREMSEEEEAKETKRGNKKRAPKRRRVEEESESEEGESSDDEEMDDDDDEQDEQEATYDIPRVDFSKVLPFELVAEILSYLLAHSLCALYSTSKTLHDFLGRPDAKQMWLKALGVKELPQLNDEDVRPAKLCSLILGKTCQFCGSTKAVVADRYILLRLCADCRELNWVSLVDIGPGEKYSDFHPATLSCVMTTPCSPAGPRWATQTRNFAYLADLQEINEQLEILQDEDNADTGATGNEPDGRQVQKSLAKARKLKRSWRSQGAVDAKKVAEELNEKFSPRVREFALERAAMKQEREKLAGWLRTHSRKLTDAAAADERDAKRLETTAIEVRRKVIEDRIDAAGVFTRKQCSKTGFRLHPLVCRSDAVTDTVWEQIEEPLYRLLGRLSAPAIYAQYKKRDEDSDDEYGRPRLPKKPKTVSTKAWRFILPEIRTLAKVARQQAAAPKTASGEVEQSSDDEEEAKSRDSSEEPRGGWIGDEDREEKERFFRPRHQKLVNMAPTKAAGAYVPTFETFLELPSVARLYKKPDFGLSGPDHKEDTELWTERLDDILEESKTYGLDLRFNALKFILANTTEMTKKELKALDYDVLNDEAYGDDFFLRPSSWLCCRYCRHIGPLDALLEHCKKCSGRPIYWFTRLLQKDLNTPFSLPLEVSCVLSAILEVANLDADDPTVTPKKLEEALDGHWLVWENAPKRRRGKEDDWRDMVNKVRFAAQDAYRHKDVLAVPVIALKKQRQRRRFRWYW